MIRQGNMPSAPGCISMREAILLQQALDGGPSGPGTGIGTQVGQPGMGFQNPLQSAFPQSPQPGNTIPGMNFLGGTAMQPQGFEQRFEQGLGRQPLGFGNSPGIRGQQGFGGSVGSPRGQFGREPPFLDPTSGQFGPIGTGMGRRPMRFRPPIDGGHSHTPVSNSIGQTRGGGGGGGGVGIPALPTNTGFPGENITPELNIGTQSNTGTSVSDINTVSGDIIGIGTPRANIPITLTIPEVQRHSVPVSRNMQAGHENNVPKIDVTAESINSTRITSGPGNSSRVTQILEDSLGLYYLFYPRPESAGLRVNITKVGFCRRDALTRERNLCMNSCYSDRQCPRDLKCCPSGCSLSCLTPSLAQENSALLQEKLPQLTDTKQAVEARCTQCHSHLDCNSHDQFCTMSNVCRGAMVCRLV